MYGCTRSRQTQWEMRPVLVNGKWGVNFLNMDNRKCFSPNGGRGSQGGSSFQSACSFNTAWQFTVSPSYKNNYQLKSMASNLCLTTSQFGAPVGSPNYMR